MNVTSSFSSVVWLSRHFLLMAKPNFATAVPVGVYLSSGSRVMLPCRITLLNIVSSLFWLLLQLACESSVRCHRLRRCFVQRHRDDPSVLHPGCVEKFADMLLKLRRENVVLHWHPETQ